MAAASTNKTDKLLAALDKALSAAEDDVYGDDEGKSAAAKRAAKLAVLKEGMAGLDDEGRAEMKRALMDSTGDEPVGARNTTPDGGVKGGGQDFPPGDDLDDRMKEGADDDEEDDDLDIDIDLDDGERRGMRGGSRKNAAKALTASVREIKSLRKRLGRLEASENRARTKPLIERMLLARANAGMPDDDLIAFNRLMLSASYKEVRERYDNEAVLLGRAPAIEVDAGGYGGALIASGDNGGRPDPIPFNGSRGGANASLQASVSELLDVGGGSSSNNELGGKTMEEALQHA